MLPLPPLRGTLQSLIASKIASFFCKREGARLPQGGSADCMSDTHWQAAAVFQLFETCFAQQVSFPATKDGRRSCLLHEILNAHLAFQLFICARAVLSHDFAARHGASPHCEPE
eukprot:3475497-Rhodomonas_salina.1